jgi:hypothetical protein
MHLQEKVDFLTGQFQGRCDLRGALTVTVHAQRLGALAQVEPRLGQPSWRSHGRVALKIVNLSREGIDCIAEGLHAGFIVRLTLGGALVHLTE